MDIDDDVPEVPEVPEVVDAGHSVYDGVIVINDDNGDDETAKGGYAPDGCLKLATFLSLVYVNFGLLTFRGGNAGSVESKNKPANGIRTVSRGDGYQENVSFKFHL